MSTLQHTATWVMIKVQTKTRASSTRKGNNSIFHQFYQSFVVKSSFLVSILQHFSQLQTFKYYYELTKVLSSTKCVNIKCVDQSWVWRLWPYQISKGENGVLIMLGVATFTVVLQLPYSINHGYSHTWVILTCGQFQTVSALHASYNVW